MLERPQSIPDAPGSYQFKDETGRIIYVGKALSLRSRLSNYFQDPARLHPRTAQMMERAASVEWIVVASDVEAIMLEYNLIKAHRPRFNIRLVDDKSYPYLAVTVGEEWPKATVMRGAKRKDTRYFGPYAHAHAIRETLDLLLRSFPIRTCSDAKFRRHQLLGRPCLLYDIERCTGPCVGAIGSEDYRTLVAELMDFLDGDIKPIVDRLEAEMRQASGELEFERAARLRDRLTSVRLAVERQQMVTERPENLDAIGIAEDELVAAVQVFHVRRGRVVGRHGFIVEKVEPLTTPQLIGRVIEQHYAETPIGIPGELLVPELPEEMGTHEEWLAGLRGGKVSVKVPVRGRKRELLATARNNAEEQLRRHHLRRASDLSSRAAGIEELRLALGLATAPLRIECYDMSHLQGTDYVGSMVVLEDGLPKPSDYRRFKVSAVQGNDDYGAMHEVLTRRLLRLKEPPPSTGEEPDGHRRRGPRFAYPPQLLLLDGGKGQLGVGVAVLEELGLTDEIAVASLAKQLEEVFVPGNPDAVRIRRDSEAIYLLQQARDEAHRFAIGYHRQLRGKRMTRGALDGIAGLGPSRKRRLIAELGGVRAVQSASESDLAELSWLPDDVAGAVYAHLHARKASKAE
ncbi:MAG: excinuclease ABC subunit UvrC [Acidimicrobiales bacterium]